MDMDNKWVVYEQPGTQVVHEPDKSATLTKFMAFMMFTNVEILFMKIH